MSSPLEGPVWIPLQVGPPPPPPPHQMTVNPNTANTRGASRGGHRHLQIGRLLDIDLISEPPTPPSPRCMYSKCGNLCGQRGRKRFIDSWGLRMLHICPCTPCHSPQGYRSKVESRHFAHHWVQALYNPPPLFQSVLWYLCKRAEAWRETGNGRQPKSQGVKKLHNLPVSFHEWGGKANTYHIRMVVEIRFM